tara:strand:+ start:693 stop:1385 length:693 start_codon:yes stop_codon:yes gene_type:complete
LEINPHILIIDDDERLRKLLRKFLLSNQFLVTDAKNTIYAKKIMNSIIFDLVVLDIMMPGQNGLEFLNEIRKNSKIPVLMLTAMSTPENRLDGLETGADDYMTKPFEPKELLLRIQNILRRNVNSINLQKTNLDLEFGPFFFNLDTQNLYKNGMSVHLTTSEQNLLKCFAESPNKALSRDNLNKMLGSKMEIRSIDVAITRIRKKIEQDQKYPIYLQTVRGIGWMLQTHN